jgi:hypothetical protein
MHTIVCSTSQTASNSSKLEIKLIQFARYLKRNELKLQDSMYHTTMKQVINRYQIIHLINPLIQVKIIARINAYYCQILRLMNVCMYD